MHGEDDSPHVLHVLQSGQQVAGAYLASLRLRGAMKVFVHTLDNAHLNTCQLLTLEFAAHPTVKDVLQQIGQNPLGVKVLSWGEDEMTLEDLVTDEQLLKVTDQAAERLSQWNEARDARDRYLRDRGGLVPDPL